MSLTLYTYPALFRTQKVLIAAQYAGVEIKVDTNVTPEVMKTKSVHGKVPCLETAEGTISESNAIARYVARLNTKSPLYGENLFESAQIDSWVDYCANELEIPATMLVAPILGWMDTTQVVTDRAHADLKKGLAALEAHLKHNTYFVGRFVTLADIAVATTLLYPMKMVLDEKARSAFPAVMRWFNTCVNQPQFVPVIGEVVLCKVPLAAAPAAAGEYVEKPKKEKKEEAAKAAKEEKPKEEKKEKRKQDNKDGDKPKEKAAAAAPAPKDDEEEPEEPVEKKAKSPLDMLPPSKFIMDAWKREYSNTPGGDCYLAMPFLWNNFDPAGYSLWLQTYKYDDENKVMFMTSNLVSGFIQRCEDVRKHAFGVMQILGQDGGPIKVVGAWLMRGTGIEPMLEANPDAEYYNWTRVENPDEAQKKQIADLFCAWESIDGMPIKDCKVFK